MAVPPHCPSLISDDPLHVSVTRGGAEESCHAVDVALCDADGSVLVGLGDVERLVFPRSAMKPLQAIALSEAWEGIDEAKRLVPAEMSLICASHNGQPEHVDAVRRLLDRFELPVELLSCGPQWSSDQPTMIAQTRTIDTPGRIHNNCSGKHAGMLVLSRCLGHDPKGYAALTHPVQQAILGTLEAMVGIDLMAHPHGRRLRRAGIERTARQLGARVCAVRRRGELPAGRMAACTRIRQGIAAAPRMIAGDRRLCTAIGEAFGEQITAKTGAEGVFAAAFHEFGLGAMVKARDGNSRAAGAAMAAVIHALGYDLPEPVRALSLPRLTTGRRPCRRHRCRRAAHGILNLFFQQGQFPAAP